MTHKKAICVFLVWLFAISLLISCSSPGGISLPNTPEATRPEAIYAGKTILWVDSYHQGYEWSDGIEKGIRSALEGTGIQLQVFRMDTKQKPENCNQAGEQAWQQIQALKPDLVIATDDNAQKCLVVPYLKDKDIPVVFAGVNWSAEEYGYPASNITGVIEVDLIDQAVAIVKPYARGNAIGYISIDTESVRKDAEIYNRRFFNGQMKTYWPKTQSEFQEMFLQAQQEVDILILRNNAGAPDWNEQEMKEFVKQNTTVPTLAVNPWMASYALVTLGKVTEEQGELAVLDALKILSGVKVSDIPIHQNLKGKMVINLSIATRLNVVFPPSLLKNAEFVE